MTLLIGRSAGRPTDPADGSPGWLFSRFSLTGAITVDDADFATSGTTTGKAFRNPLPARRK